MHKVSLNKLLPQLVVERLQQYIQSHGLKAGDRIPPEKELMEMFGVSRSTLREAIKILDARNFLEIKRGVGTFLKDNLSNIFLNDLANNRKKLLLDIVDFRLIIEPALMPLVIRHINEEQVKHLAQLCDHMEELIALHQDYYAQDVAFHTQLMALSQNRVVIQLIPVIEQAIAIFMEATSLTLRNETITTHRAVAEAIARKDIALAQRAMQDHLTYNRMIFCNF